MIAINWAFSKHILTGLQVSQPYFWDRKIEWNNECELTVERTDPTQAMGIGGYFKFTSSKYLSRSGFL